MGGDDLDSYSCSLTSNLFCGTKTQGFTGAGSVAAATCIVKESQKLTIRAKACPKCSRKHEIQIRDAITPVNGLLSGNNLYFN